MRKSLLNSFDKIYILDLHGNAKKRETAPDGSKDENVFNIMQGVGIALLVKTSKKKKEELAEVWHSELYGRCDAKLRTLDTNDINSIQWKKLNPVEPYYFFTPKDFRSHIAYYNGFGVNELFCTYSNGIKTHNDKLNACFSEQESDIIYKDFKCLDVLTLKNKYKLKDTRDWIIQNAKNDMKSNPIIDRRFVYRPFDIRYFNYTGKTKGIISYPRLETQGFLSELNNVALIASRQCASDWRYVFISDGITDGNYIATAGSLGGGFVFPLYIYKENMGKEEKVPNFKAEIYNKISDGLGFRPEPEDLFAYIYAVLHSPSYREKYKEFLKIDFPRVPYPSDKAEFEALVNIGHELISLHLMRDAEKWDVTTGFPESGTNKVDKYQYADGKVWINDEQYFSDVSSTAWNEFIGGYQPAQKWLKDRRGRQLSYDDIIHYERIIYVLDRTQSIMKEIDKIDRK